MLEAPRVPRMLLQSNNNCNKFVVWLFIFPLLFTFFIAYCILIFHIASHSATRPEDVRASRILAQQLFSVALIHDVELPNILPTFNSMLLSIWAKRLRSRPLCTRNRRNEFEWGTCIIERNPRRGCHFFKWKQIYIFIKNSCSWQHNSHSH